MDDELEQQLDGEEEGSPSSPEVQVDSPVAAFLDEFELNNITGDPFRIVQKVGRSSHLIASSTADPSSGLYGLSDRTSTLFNHLGRQVAQSSPDIINPRRLNLPDVNKPSGFISRALPDTYRSLIEQPGELKGVFFQFQQESVSASLMRRVEPTTLVTQRPMFSSPRADETTAQILLGNELTYRANADLQSPQNRVIGVQSYASFHPKIGYVGDESSRTAFIGTQNITPALAGNNSIESLLVLQSNAPSTPAGQVERALVTEIYQMTNVITRMAEDNEVYRPGQLRRQLIDTQAQRNFLYVESEIYQRLTQVISTAAFSQDKVVVSMGDISLLLKSPNSTQLTDAIARLASEGRLTVVSDARKLNTFFDDIRANPNRPRAQQIIDTLIQSNALQYAATGFQHDKTIAIFNNQGQLRFFNIGSANLSADSMVPVSQIGNRSDEYFANALQIMRQKGHFDPNAPANLDVNLMIGAGPYTDPARSTLTADPYLSTLSDQLRQHYDVLTGGNLTNRALYQTGFMAERRADSQAVEVLRQKLEQLAAQTGGVIQVEGRYSLQGQVAQTGIKVRISTPNSGTSTVLNLTVDRFGNVIIPDYNKVITGSIFINKTASNKYLPTGQTLTSGQTIQLSSVDTAIGLVGTIAREMAFQSEHGLVNQVYKRLVDTNFADLVHHSKNLIASNIAQVTQELQGTQLNLRSTIAAFESKQVQSNFTEALARAQHAIADGANLSEQQKLSRYQLLSPAFSVLSGYEFHSSVSGGPEQLAATKLLDALYEEDKVGNDLKLALILQSERGRDWFSKAQMTQTRRLVSDLMAPFLAGHELGYSGAQAQARLPIYAETDTFEDTPYGRILSAGFLNPAEVKPSTRIGEPGRYYRPVGATSHAKPLQLPGFGGVRQLNVIDSDISRGATVAYDINRLFRSTTGVALLTMQDYLSQIRQMVSELGVDQPNFEELLNEYGSDMLYFLPFNKPEQIPQRLKNVVGSRPALDVNPELVRRLRSLQQLTMQQAGDLTSGRLREVLPQAQFEQVRQKVNPGTGFDEVQEYFRDLELDPLNTQRGIIGPRSMKRIGVIGGVSLIGDSSYLNAAYQVNAGDVHRLSVKVSSRQVRNQLETEAILSKYLAKGTVVFGAPVEYEDTSLITRLTAVLQQEQRAATQQNLQSLLDTYEGGSYRDLLVKEENGRLRLFYKEGLYLQEQGSYRRAGEFTRDGLITIREVGTQQETRWGLRNQPITLKFPSFGKRYQQGISVITATPAITVSDSGTIMASTDVLTVWEPGSGSRPSGAGLVKGPFTVLQEGVFEAINDRVSDSNGATLRPNALSQERIYGLFGQGHFKGFNFETGLYLLSQPDTRSKIETQTGEQIARSLSLLFLGDEKVKAALRQSLRESPFLADAIGHLKAADFSSQIGKTAVGLLMLAEGQEAGAEAAKGSLSAVKQTVIKALSGDTQARTTLEQQSRKLINKTLTDPNSAIHFANGAVVFNEGNLVARGAGMLGHLSFIAEQLFKERRVGASSVGSLYERDLSNASKYITDISYRNVVDTVAATAGLSLPAPTPENREVIQRKLSLLQAMIRNDVVVEDIKDITVSRSLVPAGMKDEAALEYQYLLGMSTSYLKAFTRVGGGSEASKELQHAFARLLGSFRLDLPSANAHLTYRLALPGEDGFFSPLATETQKLLLSYTDLGQSLGLVMEATEHFGTAKGATASRRLTNLQRLATGVTQDGSSAIRSRAAALSRLHGLAYFSPSTDDKSSRLQIKWLQKTLHLPSVAPPESPLSMVTNVVQRAYRSYVVDRQFRREDGHELIGFKQYVDEGRAGSSVQHLEEKFKLVSELTRNSDRIVGVPLTTDDQLLTNKIQQRIEKINEKSIKSVEAQYQKNLYKEFVEGAVNLETSLQQVQTPAARQALEEIQTTKQVILPRFSAEMITTGEEAGRYRLQLKDPAQADPTVGVLLGTDVLKRAPFIFPQYTDEALRYQVQLREQLIQTEQVRRKLLTPGATVSETQLRKLQEFEDTLEQSRASVLHLMDTDFVRKAMGDRQKYTGAVGIATASFALAPDEAVLGNRFFALGDDRALLNTVNNQFKILKALPSADTLRSTQQLFSSLGFRGPATEDESRQTGVASKERIDRLFAEAIEAAHQNKLSQRRIETLRLNAISSLANIPTQRLEQTSPHELNRLLAVSSGAIRRGGAPAGSAGLTADTSFYDVMDVKSFQGRLESEGSGLVPEAERFKTGMIAPAVGRLLTMLGDFDGDAYQFLLTGTGDHASQLRSLQQDTIRTANKLASVDRRLQRGSNENLQNQRQQLSDELQTLQSQLSSRIEDIQQYQVLQDKVRLRALRDVRQWVGSYLALPDFVTDERSGISTGSLMSMVQQMSGTMPQIEDASRHILRAEHQVSALSSLIHSASVTPEMLDSSNPEVRDRVNGLLQQHSSLSYSLVEGVLSHAREQQVQDRDAFEAAARDYVALQSNVSMSFEQYNKSFKKASGTILNQADFEGLQALIGKAGTELIGKTYNVLIPMLDSAMMDQALAVSLRTSGESSFKTIINENLRNIALESGPEEQQVINNLRQKLNSGDENGLQHQLSARLSGVTGTLASLQQIIRDALKEKSDKGIVAVLRESTFNGKTLSEALEDVSTEDPLQADKQRIGILKQAVMTRIGPDLLVQPGLQETTSRLRTSPLDPGITGFGALLKMAEFSLTKDEHELYQQFVEAPGLTEVYADQQKRGLVGSVTDFAAGQVVNLIERTQASFIASTLPEQAKTALVEKYREFHRTTADPAQLDPAKRQLYDVVNEYEQERLQAHLSDDQLTQLNNRLIQETALQQVQSRNQQQGVLSIEQMKFLREHQIESRSVRFDDGDIFARMQGANDVTHNAYIRMLQRGQQVDAQDALYLAAYKLDTASTFSTGEVGELAPLDQLRMARMLGLQPGSGVLDPQEQTYIAKAMVRRSRSGLTGLQALQQSTAAMTQGVFPLIDEIEKLDGSDIERHELLRQKLKGLYKDGSLNVDRLQELGTIRHPQPVEHTQRVVENVSQELSRITSPHSNEPERPLLQRDQHLESMGVFVAPILMALAGTNAKFDDRAAQFGFDVLQSTASLSSRAETLTAQLGGKGASGAFDFTVGRIRQSIDTQGYIAGSIQGLAQEQLFQGFSQLSHLAIDSVAGKLPGGKTRAGNAVATVAAETLATVMSLSFARGLTKQETRNQEIIPDRVGDILKNISEQIWQMVEQAQVSLLDPLLEVLDTSENQQLDFEVSAIPSEFEQDMEAGLIVLDENNNPLPTEFENTMSEQAQLAMLPSSSNSNQ
jgi:hypothetical protein